MINISDLQFQYSRDGFQLRVPALSIPSGQTVAIVGPSGCGKTTLLNLIAGIHVPRTGRILTHDCDLARLRPAARRRFRIRHVGLVFQEFELLEYLNVRDNILLPCRITGSIRLNAAIRERAAMLAEQLGIGAKLGRPVRRLSQGERQRVAVCRALLLEPPLLLCDEPTGNLDPANKQHVLDLLFQYVNASGTTLVTVTHDQELLPRFQRAMDVREFLATDGGPA